MGNTEHTFYPMLAGNPDTRLVMGSFRPAGTGAVTNIKGRGATPARADVGTYNLVFRKKYPHLLAFGGFAFQKDGTMAALVAKSWTASTKTLQFLLQQQGATSARTKQKLLDILSARLPSAWHRVDLTRDLRIDGSNPPTFDSVVGGWAFDADAEKAYLGFRVPDDWDGASDMQLVIVWHPEDGTAITDTNTVIWETDYYSVAAGEAVDNGTLLEVDTTYTQAGPGTDKEEIRTAVTLDFDNTNQPLAKGDTVHMVISRDKTTDTYAADAVIARVELRYKRALQLVQPVDADGAAPYIERVNGATDPTSRLVWPAGNVDPVQLPPIYLPADLNASADAYVKLRAKMSDTNDTPVIAVGAYEDIGDTDCGGNTGALSDSIAEVAATIDNGDISGHPKVLNVTLTPGAHNTDKVELYGAELEYQSSESNGAFAAADLAANANNQVHWWAMFQNSGQPAT